MADKKNPHQDTVELMLATCNTANVELQKIYDSFPGKEIPPNVERALYHSVMCQGLLEKELSFFEGGK